MLPLGELAGERFRGPVLDKGFALLHTATTVDGAAAQTPVRAPDAACTCGRRWRKRRGGLRLSSASSSSVSLDEGWHRVSGSPPGTVLARQGSQAFSFADG